MVPILRRLLRPMGSGVNPKARTWLPAGALAPGVQHCGCERAGGVYTAVAQAVKTEILV